MAQSITLSAGQFWRDTTNGDVLKIEAVRHEATTKVGQPHVAGPDYAFCRCQMYIKGRWFGMIDMDVDQFTSGRYAKIRAPRLRRLVDRIFGSNLYPILPEDKQPTRIGDAANWFVDEGGQEQREDRG